MHALGCADRLASTVRRAPLIASVLALVLAPVGCGGDDEKSSDGSTEDVPSAQQVYDEFSTSCQAGVDQLVNTGADFEDAVRRVRDDVLGLYDC